MGWKGYESSIPAGMLVRKMYCSGCGTQLKRRKVTNIYQKGEPEYTTFLASGRTLGMDRLEKVTYMYECPACKRQSSYEEQKKIARIQKKANKLILYPKEKEEA